MTEQIETKGQTVKVIEEREGRYLTFPLANEEYGVSVFKIKEIIAMMPITPVPQTPEYMKGVFNLRVKVIPLVDLRLRFRMKVIDYTDRTCIIVSELGGQSETIIMGIVVDAVSELLSIKGEEIEDTPTFGIKLDTDYILGMAKVKGAVKILLDIDQVLNAEEVALSEKAA